MTAFTNHFSLEFRTGIRNKTLLLMNYLFPVGFYLMMGFVMPAINPTFRAMIIPSMVVFAILAATMLGLPDPLVNARETGIFRSYKINGIPSLSISPCWNWRQEKQRSRSPRPSPAPSRRSL